MTEGRPDRSQLTVAITGSDGFIGQELIRQLQLRGHRAEGLGDEHALDVRDANAVHQVVQDTKPDVVVHLAAVSGPMLHVDRPDFVTEVNTVGTVNVLEAARRAGGVRVVLASSVAGYTSGTEEQPMPSTVYGLTKRYAELAGRLYAEEFGVDVTAARIGSVYGVGRKTEHLFNRMVASALRTREIRYDVTGWEPLVHVVDCARFLAALAEVPRWRPVYNFSTTPESHQYLARLVRDALGMDDVSLVPEPAPVIKWPLRFDAGPLLADTGLTPSVQVESGVHDLVTALAESESADVKS